MNKKSAFIVTQELQKKMVLGMENRSINALFVIGNSYEVDVLIRRIYGRNTQKENKLISNYR